jgi:hypothetical protein
MNPIDWKGLKLGILEEFGQDNHSQSREGVLCGLHFLKPASVRSGMHVPMLLEKCINHQTCFHDGLG